MPHRVHPAMKEMHPPALEAMVDRARLEPERRQLPPRYDTMLPLRQGCDHGVNPTTLQLTPYYGVKDVLVGHAPHRARRNAAAGA